MSRRSLIVCLAALAASIVFVVMGVAFLFQGADVSHEETEVPDSPQYALMSAVPVDAVMVGCFSSPDKVLSKILPADGFASSLASLMTAQRIDLPRMTVSLHNLGSLYPLYVLEAGAAQAQPSEGAKLMLAAAQEHSLYAEYVDCSSLADARRIAGHSVVLASPFKELVLSSKRHLKASESVLKAAGFSHAYKQARGADCMFISNNLSEHLVSSLFHRNLRSFFSAGKKMSDWIVLGLDELSDVRDCFSGSFASDAKQPDMPGVFDGCGVSESDLSRMLPSYTVSAITLPLKKRTEFLTAYEAYLDAKQGLQRKLILRKRLEDATGVSPEEFCERLDVREVATAAFKVDEVLQRVNLVKVGNLDKSLVSSSSELKDYKFASYVGSLFGDVFVLKDEAYYTYVDGWIISGSKAAVAMYVSGEALFYNLRDYMANADLADMFSRPASFMAYLSFTVEPDMMKGIFREDVLAAVAGTCEGVDYSGAFVTVGESGHFEDIAIEVFRNEIKRSKAPFQARDTVVVIPTGPFTVKNARTGTDNLFYQNLKNNYLCLKDETGKGVWGVPFDKPICGTAHSIDYLGNNKYQILFGAGSKLHLIDVLGRFVGDFDVDLGKEILLGPDVYDLDGSRRYMVMVLHKDNTIEMYDLKGRRPENWSTISASAKIKALPERLVVEGKTFWVVRTAVQTLIYPFEGGAPVTVFEGDQMALPETEINVIDNSSVEVLSYDGKRRIIKLI